jgi:two-component system LytT family response regulator/two-component system response regulator LytT
MFSRSLSSRKSSSLPSLRSHPIAARIHPAYTGFSASMPINTLIVDDEKHAREELAFLLKSFPDIHLVAQGKNGLEAVTLIKENAPDLVFLDVQMPGLDGFGVLQNCRVKSMFLTCLRHRLRSLRQLTTPWTSCSPFDKARIAAIQRARREISRSFTDRLNN